MDVLRGRPLARLFPVDAGHPGDSASLRCRVSSF
ncbi:hypothetical protein Ae706Ps2_4557c [Pseudonocardia sp. Ae706_Ps2]|nr:hypothetical protein Ae706Ps2_6249c [Pseudonocardia sp. Ae706_Ps2]OLM09865.1 hypothetical protein Ae706Ps2_6327c [Pseudonocardia sp. Ae706_Ps2]OLM26124.1 hypothetical protein Ae706Ps2_4557c [Pseudonocardia sp. Ae706_Ps2]